MTNTLKVKLLSDDATLPKRNHDTDAGYDIYASETRILEPQEFKQMLLLIFLKVM